MDIELAYARCLYCRAPFRPEDEADGPAGRRFAFDPARARAWLVCGACNRWNLYPLDERIELLDALERRVRDHGRLLVATGNIALFAADDDSIVRIGSARLAEQAWWRYGRTLHVRRASFDSARSRITAAAGSAASYLGEKVGLRRRIPTGSWDDSASIDALRWVRFGSLAWEGRSRCPHCRSVLRALEFEESWWVHPLLDEHGRLAIGVPCSRCDPWTPDKLWRIGGEPGALLLRRILAYQNIAGGSSRMVGDAARAIEEAGSAEALARRLADRGASLARLGPTLALALEIAVNENAERVELVSEARMLEAVWRREEEVARIVDEEL